MFLSGISGRYLFGVCSIIVLITIAQPFSVFCQVQGRENVGIYVTVSPSSEKSNLDNRTRMMTSTADITIINTSDRTLLPPLHAVIDTGGEQVKMPEALGGPGTQPYGKYYYDLSRSLTNGGLSQGQRVTFKIQFVRNAETRFTYSITTYGSVE
jgi:hypothetical protein